MKKASVSVEASPEELRERSEILYEASLLLTQPLNLTPGLERAFASLMHRGRLTACALFLGDNPEDLRCDFASGLSSLWSKTLRVRSGEGMAGVAYASGRRRLAEGAEAFTGDPLLEDLRARHHLRSALWVPLVAEGSPIGVAAFLSAHPDVFPPQRIETLEAFCHPLALALRNRRDMTRLQASHERLEAESASAVRELHQVNQQLIRKTREFKTIYDLALTTAAGRRVEDIARPIIQGVCNLAQVQAGAFFLNGAEGVLAPIAPAFGLEGAEARDLVCAARDCPAFEAALRERQPQILQFLDSGLPLPQHWSTLRIRSMLVLPLLQGEAVKGLFCAINKLSGLFSEEDVRLTSLLTHRVADVLERLALDEQLRQRVHDLSVMQEMASHLPSPPVLTDTVSATARGVRSAIPDADACLFFVHHVESEALVAMGGDWKNTLTLDIQALTTGVSERVPVAEVFQKNEAARYDAGAAAGIWASDLLVGALDPRQLIYLPLSVEQGRIGVMAIATFAAGGFSPDSQRLAEWLSHQAAIIIERARLYERLRTANTKLEHMNRLKNEFISMVSHELRTPLTTIKGFVSIVRNEETGPLNDQQSRFLETSDRAIDRLTLLVSDLLDISRMEAGQIKMQLRPSTLREIVARVGTAFAPTFQSQNLSFTVQIPDGLPPIMADPDRLTQVFDNLLSNAAKFTSRGGITVSAFDKGDFVMISVKDTGSGIPPEELDRVFEKFYQIKTGNAWPSKGTGLGLAIVRSIIESHRGKIWVESEVGKGADFRFLIPRARPEALEPPAKA